jgi:hypothetical protein
MNKDAKKLVRLQINLDAKYSRKWRALEKKWPTVGKNKHRIMLLLDMVEKTE